MNIDPTELHISVVGIIVEKYLPPYGMQRSVCCCTIYYLSNSSLQAAIQLV